MPIQNTGQDLRLRGNSGDGVTDIKEEISNDPYTGEASLGTLNTVRYATVAEGSVVTGRAMSEMQGYSAFTGALPQTEATGALGESLYFNSSDEIVYLDRDADFTNTNTTGTFSFWLKRNDPDNADATIYSSGDNQTNRVWIRYNSSGSVTDKNLQVVATTSNSTKIQLVYDAPFLDTASWYHVVVAIDTTKNYQYDRVRTYVNGIELKDLETGTKSAIWPSQNDAIKFNNNQRIGDPIWVTGYSSNMVIADFKFIENKQLRPDSFGKLLNGIWIPQAYAASDDTEITSNLIAKYDFIDNANDTSGSATTYNGSASNVTYYRNNYHIADFNGSSSVIEVPSKIPASLDFSISFWFNSTSTYAHSYIFSTKHNSVTNGWWIVFNRTTGAGTINYGEGNGSLNATTAETSINTLGDGDWHHAVVTRATGGIVNIYIDGVHDVVNHSVGSGYMTSSTWHDNLHIGKYAGTNALYYDGYLGEAQVYTDVLTPDEALQQYNATKHKYAYGINGFWLPLNNTSTGSIDSSSNLKLHLDASDSSSYSGSGTNWNDLTSNNNDGTISGANYLSSTNGGVFDFDGSNDSVSISGQIPNSLSSNYTVEALFNADTINSTGGTIFKNWYSSGAWVAGTGELRVHNYNGNKLRWYSVTGNGSSTVQVYDTTINLDTSKWYHAVLIADASGGAPTLYLNGILTAIPSLASTFLSSAVSNSHIGGNSQGSAYFDGKIAQVRVYDKALTANEAITNYRATQGNYEQVSTVDISGNANSFTSTNIDYTDHIPDEPLDNRVTFDPNNLWGTGSPTLSDGNKVYKSSSTAEGFVTTTKAMPRNGGKYYFEMKSLAGTGHGVFGITDTTKFSPRNSGGYNPADQSEGFYVYNRSDNLADIYKNGASLATDAFAFAISGGVVAFAIDTDNDKYWTGYASGGSTTWYNSGDPAAGTNETSSGLDYDFYMPFTSNFSAGSGRYQNTELLCDDNEIVGAAPTGFKLLSFNNLPAPTFDPDGVIQDKPSNYFKAVTYQGTGAQQGNDYGFIEGSRAAVFNGSNSYITVNDKLTPSSGAFSISWWMNWNGDADYAYVFDNGGGSAGNGLYCIVHDLFDNLYFGFKNGGTLFQSNSGAPSIEKNTWIHWCLTWDGTTGTDKFKVYKNGVATSFTSTVANTTPAYNFRIGEQNGTGGEHINAKIDDLRVYHDVLTPDEVGYLYNNTTASIPSDNLEAHYKFDGNANEASTPIGNIDSGQSAVFNGSSNIIKSTGLGVAYRNQTTLSLSYWIKSSGGLTSTGINTPVSFSDSGDGSTDLFMYFRNNQSKHLIVQNRNNGTAIINFNTNFVIADGNWHHVGFTADSNGHKIYIDGNQITPTYTTGSASTQISMPNDLTQFNIGANQDSGGNQWFMNGQIDQVRVYSSALSSSDITALSKEDNVPTANLDAHYKLDGNGDDATGNYNATSVSVSSYTSPAQHPIGYTGTEFNITYTQDKSYGNIDVGFAPDFVWIKKRSGGTARDHMLYDSIRGAGNRLRANQNYAASDATDELTSFDNNGFTTGGSDATNGNSYTYVTWAWKAGGEAVENIDGDLTTQVSANTEAGFSIATYTGSYTGGDTTKSIGHGLNFKPDIFIVKNRTQAKDWYVYTDIIDGSMDYLYLNQADNKGNSTRAVSTNTVNYIGGASTNNVIGNEYVVYSFHSVDGFSKIGSYNGNGSSNGPFIYTGFKPAWLMVKWTNDPNSNSSWVIYDNARNTVNEVDTSLRSNNNSADSTASTRDFLFLSNGFKADGNSGTINDSSGNYIYMAFAEDPVKYSNGVATLGDGNEFIQDGNYPEDNFNTTLYTGTGAATKISTGLNADFVWAKTRSFSATTSHRLVDTLRPAKNHLYLPNTLAQTFDSAGITIENDGFSFAGNEGANLSGRPTVAWSWKAGGLINKAAEFNGSSSKITLPTGSPFNDSNTIKAVSAWVKADTSTSRVYPLSISSTSNANDYWYIGYLGDLNRIYVATRDGSSSNQNQRYATITPDTNWNHIVAQLNGSTVEIWMNGVQLTVVDDISGTATSSSWISYPSYSGTVQGAIGVLRLASTSYGQGSIDQVRIFNKALSTNNGGTNEIEKLYNETAADLDTLQILGDTSCVAAYKLGEDAIDLSGNYNGTASNVTFNLPGHLTRNNKGTVESEVSANQTNGFSIVKYTGNDVNGQSIGHGLGAPPEFIIIKCLTLATNWMVYTLPTGNDQKLYLNSSAAKAATGNMNYQTPTDDVFFVGGGNETGDLDDDYIAYCWYSVPGFSKIGKYTGNGSSSGPFIYTGFEPAWIMIKRTNATEDWKIIDNKRDNFADALEPNEAISEENNNNSNFITTSNGFQMNDTSGDYNANGGTYIYLAFAHR